MVFQVDDPRLDCAILRPMKSDHDSFLAYYLTQDDDSASKFKETRFGILPYEVPEDQDVSVFGRFLMSRNLPAVGDNLPFRSRL